MKLYQNKEWLSEKIKTIGNLKKIGDLANCSSDTIEYWRKKFNIPRNIVFNRKHHFNEKYFSVIDSEEKAYWLGFIMADGCIEVSSNSHESVRLAVILKNTDIHRLKKLAHSLEFNGQIFEKEIVDKRGFSTTRCELKINSKMLCSDLLKYGIVPKKTGKELIPCLNDDLIRHFLRGFFDGDGSITLSSNKKFYRFKLGSSSLIVTRQTQEYFHNYDVDVNYYVDYNYRRPFYVLESNCKEKCNQIFHLLYDDANIYLDRKYDRVLDFFNKCPSVQ